MDECGYTLHASGFDIRSARFDFLANVDPLYEAAPRRRCRETPHEPDRVGLNIATFRFGCRNRVHGGFLHGNLVHERIDHALGVRLVLCRKQKARGAHVPPSEPVRAKIRRGIESKWAPALHLASDLFLRARVFSATRPVRECLPLRPGPAASNSPFHPSPALL
jgi:hypothetical protein